MCWRSVAATPTSRARQPSSASRRQRSACESATWRPSSATKLFRRSGPKVEPTAAASALALQISEALNLMRAAVSDCRGGAEPLRLRSCLHLPAMLRRHGCPAITGCRTRFRSGSTFPPSCAPERPSMSRCAPVATVRLRGAPADACRVHADAQSGPAATIELSEPADLAALPLLPHEDWPQWFREAGAEHFNLRFYADDYSTHELDAQRRSKAPALPCCHPSSSPRSSVRQVGAAVPARHAWSELALRAARSARDAATGAWLLRLLEQEARGETAAQDNACQQLYRFPA